MEKFFEKLTLQEMEKPAMILFLMFLTVLSRLIGQKIIYAGSIGVHTISRACYCTFAKMLAGKVFSFTKNGSYVFTFKILYGRGRHRIMEGRR